MGSTVCTHFLDLAIAAQLSVTAALVCFTWTTKMVADQLYSFNSHGPRSHRVSGPIGSLSGIQSLKDASAERWPVAESRWK
jgi:hypothetical protein